MDKEDIERLKNIRKQIAHWKDKLKNNGGDSQRWRMAFLQLRYWYNEEWFWKPDRWFDVYGFNKL